MKKEKKQKIKKKKQTNNLGIKQLCEWFGMEYIEQKGLIGYLKFNQSKKQLTEKMKNLLKMLGIENATNMDFQVVTQEKSKFYANLITDNSVYNLGFCCGNIEDYPTIEVKNDQLKSKYEYVKRQNRLSCKLFEYCTGQTKITIANKENIGSQNKIVRIGIQSDNHISIICFQGHLTLPCIGISKVEKVIKKLESNDIKEANLYFEILKKLLPTIITELKTISFDINIEGSRLYKIFRNGNLIKNAISRNGDPLIDLEISRKKEMK